MVGAMVTVEAHGARRSRRLDIARGVVSASLVALLVATAGLTFPTAVGARAIAADDRLSAPDALDLPPAITATTGRALQ
jgi:hypothetical protein